MNVLKLQRGAEEDESVLTFNSNSGAQIWKKIGHSNFYWHRLRGPARIYSDGREQWWRNNIRYIPTAHERMMWELRKKNEFT